MVSEEVIALSRFCSLNGLSSVPPETSLRNDRGQEVLLPLDPVQVTVRQAVPLPHERERLSALDVDLPGGRLILE